MEKAYWRRKLPQGFQFWMENLGRSVVYAQPDNIYEHAAKYLEEKLMERNMALERLPKNSYLQKLALKKNGRKSENEDAVSKDDENEAILRVDGAKADSAHTFQAKKSSKEQNAKSLGAITSKDIPSSSQLQRTAGDESGRETPVEVTNAVARTLEVAQEQSSDDTAAMEEQAETESQEDAHASHEKTLLLESSQAKVSDQDSTNWKGSSGTNSDDAQSVAYSEENQDSGKNDLKDEDIKNSFSKRDDEVENIGASDFKSTEQRRSVSNTEKLADITATEKEPSISEEESVGPQKPIPDSSPAVPAAESGPVVPVVESGPVVPVVVSVPVAPVVESGPVAPVVESGPVAPVVESGPVAPVVESGPVAPVVESGPVAPVVESGPVVPAAESGPVVPVVDVGPVVPVVDAGPVVPFVEAGPVVPVAESGPVVPADESAPVAKSGPEMSVAESSPVVPAAESGPVVPAAGSDLVVPAVESGPDDKAAESVPVVSADESFVGEEELVVETKTIAEQESSQTADTADKEDSNEEEQTVEVGAVSCSVEAVVTTEEDSQQNSEAKGDETENGGEGAEHAEEHPMEDRKDSHQAVMNPAESAGRVDEIAQIADSLDIITHHEEEAKDGVESSVADSEPLEKMVQPSEETESPAMGTESGTDTQEKITESAEIAETSGETGVEGDSTNTDTENPTETNQDAPTVEDQLTEDGTTASKEDHTAKVPAVAE